MSDIDNPYRNPAPERPSPAASASRAPNRTNQFILASLAVVMFSIAFARYGTVDIASTVSCTLIGAASLVGIPFCKRPPGA